MRLGLRLLCAARWCGGLRCGIVWCGIGNNINAISISIGMARMLWAENGIEHGHVSFSYFKLVLPFVNGFLFSNSLLHQHGPSRSSPAPSSQISVFEKAQRPQCGVYCVHIPTKHSDGIALVELGADYVLCRTMVMEIWPNYKLVNSLLYQSWKENDNEITYHHISFNSTKEIVINIIYNVCHKLYICIYQWIATAIQQGYNFSLLSCSSILIFNFKILSNCQPLI